MISSGKHLLKGEVMNQEELAKYRQEIAKKVGEFLKLTNFGYIGWQVSVDKSTILGNGDGFTVLVQRIDGRVCGRISGCSDQDYVLTVFGKGARWPYAERHCPSRYNSDSEDLHIMNLYDVVVFGKKREKRPAHVCGLTGFGVGLDGLGDVCPACAARNAATK